MAYLLDANVFIQAKRLHYGLDFCPAFWEWLIAENGAGRVVSIDKVSDEIEAGADELWDWAKARGDKFFLPPDAALPTALATVSTWATGRATSRQRWARSCKWRTITWWGMHLPTTMSS